MPPVLYYNNDVHENERKDVHEQTGIGYFERDPAIPLPEPACAGGAVWVSLGMVNRSVKALQGQGFLTTDMELTEKARLEMAKHRPKNAVILAAGYGMRMVPINMETPKGLLEVEGEPLIERLIRQLHAVKVKEIYVVVGFKRNSTIIWLTGMA